MVLETEKLGFFFFIGHPQPMKYRTYGNLYEKIVFVLRQIYTKYGILLQIFWKILGV